MDVGVTVSYFVVVRMVVIGEGNAVAWMGITVTKNCLGESIRLGESDSTFSMMAAGALPMFRGDGVSRRPRRISLDIVAMRGGSVLS